MHKYGATYEYIINTILQIRGAPSLRPVVDGSIHNKTTYECTNFCNIVLFLIQSYVVFVQLLGEKIKTCNLHVYCHKTVTKK